MLSSENNGMYMPVAPAYGGNGFGMGGDWAWIILLLLAFGGGWGNGFGGYGMNDMYPWLNNSNQMNNGFQNQMLNTSINGIQQAITSGFGDMQTALCGGFAGVNAGIANGFAQAEIAANSRQMADMNQMFGLSQQFAQCCCDNRLATCQTQNIVQNEGAATRSAIQNGVQAVLDKMCQDKIDAKNEKIVELNNRINFLEENNYVQNSLTAQTQYLISQLKTDTPAAG